MIEPGKTYRIKGQSKYFTRKYRTPNPEIIIEKALDYHQEFNPPTFLYIGRMLAEGLPSDKNTFYGHIQGMGEVVHETELEAISVEPTPSTGGNHGRKTR